MKLSIEIPEAAAAKLREEADRLGMRPEELASAAVIDLLYREANDFQAAADYTLQKNRELYQRLA